MTANSTTDYYLKLTSPDQPGILARVSHALAGVGCDIREAAVYGDPETGEFFVRMELRTLHSSPDQINEAITSIHDAPQFVRETRDASMPMRTIIAVSKPDHCLRDLLHKVSVRALPIEIAAIVSNHQDAAEIAEWYDTPFHYVPMTEDKRRQENVILDIFSSTGSELLVLARYMQVLSAETTERLFGKCINIHHSFLPGFKGARPYHRAHARGVKLIGATAHYVTTDLDEGPIIEQDVRRVSHNTSLAEMIEIGREIEASVLARAVKWHAESRVFISGSRTVVIM